MSLGPGLPSVERILVGLDGSTNSRHALEWAICLAEVLEAEIVAVHAVGLLWRSADGSPGPSHPHLNELRDTFESNWCTPLEATSIKNRRICRDGPAVETLLDVAEEESVDLVIVGTRGAGGFVELLLGSTSLQLVEHSRRPVLVIPPRRGA